MLGCAAGFWIHEMAMHFSQCEFVGLDVSQRYLPLTAASTMSISRAKAREGRRCRLFLPTCNRSPLMLSTSFHSLMTPSSFVYQRGMGLDYNTTQQTCVMHKLQRVTKTGDYVELVEADKELRRARNVITPPPPPVLIALKSRYFDLGIERRSGYIL
ncbi:uncharacterized protein VTP21DRAFT_9629 [Calcarisporiella thermophila]|uniref:uncharacterized protein n=1 Tax=Calcarisporiella thermophila TaxID=911321 RepID=UPI003742B6B5